jgi:Holliday junction DNA helicase RuvA
VIASVRGTVLRAGLDSVVVDVGGVGLLVHTTPRTAAGMRSGQSVTLATALVVREESLTLFGFADDDERSVFETVQTVSGFGPRLALAMLAVHSPDAVRAAISTGDLLALTKVPGIGRKGAERIVLELRDKIGVPTGPATSADRPATAAWQGQVRDALVGLGWTPRQADDALEAVSPQATEGTTVSALLKAALQELGR